MKNLPVNWHEGLFLHPHHFQAADRYWTELTSTSEQWDHPYNYGLQEYSCGFEGNVFRVDKIHARMRDGTLIRRDENAPPLTIDLTSALLRDAPVRIYLCVPKLRPRDANVTPDGGDQRARYLAIVRQSFDENQSGGNEQELECRELNVRLLLESDERQGYEQLPIAQVKRSASDDASPQLDEHYIPPVLGIDASLQLGKGVVRGVHDLLIQQINELVELLRDVNIRDHILEVAQSGRVALLDRLNEMSTVLGVMLPALGIHPLTSYGELCWIVAKLAIFAREKRVPKLPRYDHDNLGPIFREVASLIRVILESIQFKDYLQKNFVWEGNIMQAELTPAWFDPRVDWYIGVDRADRASDADCRELLSRKNDFLWKFGGKDRDIYQLQAVGLKLQEIDRVTALPPHQYWSYWQVAKDELDHVYRAVSKTQIVAAFMSDRKNRSFEPSQYVGTSRFPVVTRNGELVEFQLSLFGVRR